MKDRCGAREARRLGADIGAGGQVDDQDQGDAEQAQADDDASQAAAFGAQHYRGDEGGDQGERDQDIGVGGAGGFAGDGRRRRRGQPGVGRLTDLDAAVGDELRDDEADRRGEDQEGDPSRRGKQAAGPGRAAGRQRRHSPQHPFAAAEAPQCQDRNRT